ncbi:MAG: chromosome partitioning protein ParB [Acidobacteria bacterium]|nr:MAG: chromosome partitioning protein ParB [Acidobacteriota bacterium]
MGRSVKDGFEVKLLTLPISKIAPQRELPLSTRSSTTYKQISASVKEVGLVQALIVFPQGEQYLLLDGHLRLDVISQLGWTEVECIIATDDEAYTYNKRVNHLPPVAQHYMLRKALSKGLTEERLAKALDVDINRIRRNTTMLEGICSEAIEILKDKDLPASGFAILRKMKPFRQIEAAEHMVASAKYTCSFAQALLAMTPPELLVDSPHNRKIKDKPPEIDALLREEKESIVRDLKTAEASYGTDILALTVSCGYLQRVLQNRRIEKHLEKHFPEILHTLRLLIAEVKPSASEAVAS